MSGRRHCYKLAVTLKSWRNLLKADAALNSTDYVTQGWSPGSQALAISAETVLEVSVVSLCVVSLWPKVTPLTVSQPLPFYH